MSWLSSWNKRIKLEIDGTKVLGDLTDFPLCIVLSSGTGITNVDVTQIFDELITVPGSKKIAVTISDASQCYVEIESWDWINEKACLWVKIPTLTSGTNADLYLYYDSAHDDNSNYVGDVGDTVCRNVWDDNFVSVYHMAQIRTTGPPYVYDSSGYMNHLWPYNVEYGDLVDGLYGKSIQLDGSNEYLTAADTDSLDLTTKLTLESFSYLTSADVVDSVFNKGTGDATGYQIRYDSGNLGFIVGGTSLGHAVSAQNIWTYAAGTNDTDTMMYLYRNGQLVTSGVAGTAPANGELLYVGRRWDGYYYAGKLDELRISDIARSDAYCTLNYYNFMDNLLTVVDFEQEAQWYFSGTVYEQTIPVSGTIVNVYRRDTGELAGSTTSSGDGNYYLETTYSGLHYIVALDADSGVDYNLARLDRMTPVSL